VDDEERFTGVFRSYHARVLAYARRRVAQDVASDVVADTFLAAWRHLDRLPADPLPWLYRAASFEIARQRRQQRRDVRLRDMASAPPRPVESDFAGDVVWNERWKQAFALLSERDREVLRLVAWEGLEPNQAAVVLACSTVAFKVRLHRARRRLVGLVEGTDHRGSSVTERDTEDARHDMRPTLRIAICPSPSFDSGPTVEGFRMTTEDSAP
jgi:RNA polymerase sigma factor (sigma-70 family)